MNILVVLTIAIGAFILGQFVGYFACCLKVAEKTIGKLRVDHSEPDEPPALFLEMNTDPDSIVNKPYVVLSVEAKDFIPHE